MKGKGAGLHLAPQTRFALAERAGEPFLAPYIPEQVLVFDHPLLKQARAQASRCLESDHLLPQASVVALSFLRPPYFVGFSPG